MVFSSFLYSEEYDKQIVKKIDIQLESRDPEYCTDIKKIISQFKTQEGAAFNEQTFDNDLKALAEQFEDVKPSIVSEDNALHITLHLTPLPTIMSIQWNNNKYYSSKKLQSELGIKPGNKFVKDKFNKALNKIKDLYFQKGYFESEIHYRTEMVPNKDQVIIHINVNEGTPGKVKSIIFEGFSKDEEAELKPKLFSKKYNILISWLTGSGAVHKEALEQDEMTVTNYLNNEGYADAKVQILLEDDPASSGKTIKIIAQKGIIYHIGKITFSGNEKITAEEIEKKITIKTNDLFSPDKLRDITQAIKDLYGQKGYIETQVVQSSYLSPCDPIYDIHFDIEEGDQFKIGIIHVFGNCQTKCNVILRESLLIPGENFDTRRLKATQQRLEGIGYFKNVNVYAVKNNNTADNFRDVYIEVEETSTGSANVSLGFSSMNDIFGSFELAERNFNIRGFGSLFKDGPSALRGAGEYANIKATLGKRQQAYNFVWMDPYFRDSLWRFGFDASITRSKLTSKDYRVDTYGGSVFASYPLSNYWTFGNKYRLRHSLTELSNSKKNKTDIEIEDNHGLISAYGVSISYDSTDRPYKAHRGIRSFLETEYSGIWGDFYFFKFNFINSVYVPLWSKCTLKFRGDVRFLEPVLDTNKSELPESERYFLGGETTVRGYKPYILGPRRPGKPDDPIGGISSTLLSAESSYALFTLMDIFLFFDAGNVNNQHFSIRKFNASYGIGTRLEVMNKVPITIGYGIPINPDHKGDKQKFFFSMGGQF